MHRKKGVSVAMLQYFLQHPVFIRIDDSIFLDAYQMTGILVQSKTVCLSGLVYIYIYIMHLICFQSLECWVFPWFNVNSVRLYM